MNDQEKEMWKQLASLSKSSYFPAIEKFLEMKRVEAGSKLLSLNVREKPDEASKIQGMVLGLSEFIEEVRRSSES